MLNDGSNYSEREAVHRVGHSGPAGESAPDAHGAIAGPESDPARRPGAVRGLRPGHPLALSFFDALRNRSAADRTHVLEVLREQFKAAAFEAGFGSLGSLMARCARDGGTTSARGYEKWRVLQPDAEALPTAAQIRYAHGGWRLAMEAAGKSLPADVTAARLLGADSFSPEELGAVIRVFAKARGDGPFLLPDFQRWLRAPEGLPPGMRAPRSIRCLYNHFGSWQAALHELELNAGCLCCIRTREDQARARRKVTRPGAQSDDRILETLAAAASDIGKLTVIKYTEWRRAHPVIEADGRRLGAPNSDHYVLRFGSWARACVLATGVCSPSPQARRHDDQEFKAWVARATDDLAAEGAALTTRSYDCWRVTVMARNENDQPPTAATIRRRAGTKTFAEAIDVVLRDTPGQAGSRAQAIEGLGAGEGSVSP